MFAPIAGRAIEAVLAPDSGVFRPRPPLACTTEGELVAAGQTLGFIATGTQQVPVHSPTGGFLMEIAAHRTVTEGQPIAMLLPTTVPLPAPGAP